MAVASSGLVEVAGTGVRALPRALWTKSDWRTKIDHHLLQVAEGGVEADK